MLSKRKSLRLRKGLKSMLEEETTMVREEEEEEDGEEDIVEATNLAEDAIQRRVSFATVFGSY